MGAKNKMTASERRGVAALAVVTLSILLSGLFLRECRGGVPDGPSVLPPVSIETLKDSLKGDDSIAFSSCNSNSKGGGKGRRIKNKRKVKQKQGKGKESYIENPRAILCDTIHE